MAPPVTVIAPAHNEETSIRVAVRNLLELDYPQLEVIVVNDGSEDRTFEELREEFGLRQVRVVYVPEAKSAPCVDCIESDVDARLTVMTRKQEAAKPTRSTPV